MFLRIYKHYEMVKVKSHYVSRFDGKGELVDILLDSAMIPIVTGLPKFTEKVVVNGKLRRSRNMSM